MCFAIQKKFKEPFRLEFDILVYKLGFSHDNMTTFTPYCQRSFYYEKNKENQDVTICPVDGRYIYEGYHSYTSIYTAKKSKCDEKIALFVIPKNTTFFYNSNDNEIVSEKIIYVAHATEKYVAEFRAKGCKLVSELNLKPTTLI